MLLLNFFASLWIVAWLLALCLDQSPDVFEPRSWCVNGCICAYIYAVCLWLCRGNGFVAMAWASSTISVEALGIYLVLGEVCYNIIYTNKESVGALHKFVRTWLISWSSCILIINV